MLVKQSLALLFSLCLLETPSAVASMVGGFRETQTLTIANPSFFEDFGYSVAAANNLMIAGAINSDNAAGEDVGAAYIYRRLEDGSWNQTARLLTSDGQHNDTFGSSVDINGNFALVGARGHDHVSSGEGAAYLFRRNTDTDWEQIGEFVAPVGSDNFGWLVDMDSSQAAVSGIHRVRLGPGPLGTRGFINILEQTGAASWAQTQRIDIGNQLSFVDDVAIHEGTLVAGTVRRATREDVWTHAVEIFEDSPGGFVRTATLSPPTDPTTSGFGWSVDLDQDRLLIGALTESVHGAAYIYERNASGMWEQAARLQASNFNERYYFGNEVALVGDLALVNSWARQGAFQDGLVYVFQRNDAGDWIEVDRLSNPGAHDAFGSALAITEGQLLIGDGINSAGAVHVFSPIPEPTTAVLSAWLAACLAVRRPIRCWHSIGPSRSEAAASPACSYDG